VTFIPPVDPDPPAPTAALRDRIVAVACSRRRRQFVVWCVGAAVVVGAAVAGGALVIHGGQADRAVSASPATAPPVKGAQLCSSLKSVSHRVDAIGRLIQGGDTREEARLAAALRRVADSGPSGGVAPELVTLARGYEMLAANEPIPDILAKLGAGFGNAATKVAYYAKNCPIAPPAPKTRLFIMNATGTTTAATFKALELRILGYVISGTGEAPSQQRSTVACRDGFNPAAHPLTQVVEASTSIVAFPKSLPRAAENADCIITMGTFPMPQPS
jgi:hypothetical protein